MSRSILKSKIALYSSLCSIVIGITACAHIPTDEQNYPQKNIASAQLASDIALAKLAPNGWPEAQWWNDYQDSQLNRLIEHALKDSPTLEIAGARAESAHAALRLDRAADGIDVGFHAAVNRQRYSANGLFPAPIGGNYFSAETMQIQARTNFDWWGSHKAKIAAALGEENARRADYAQAEQSLAAAVAQNYFALQSGWARLANLQEIIRLQNVLIATTTRRINHGLASIDEQHTAQARLDELLQQASRLEVSNTQEREALRALVNADANANVISDLKPQPQIEKPHRLPTQLGFELLARRADLQAARWRVEASLSRIDVARAAFYPDINLTGSFGLDAISLDHLLRAGSRTLFIGPTLSLPLFNSNSLQANLGGARAAHNEMIADYNQAVFNAVRDVAQNGATLQGIEKQIVQQQDAARLTDALLQSAQTKFKQGLIDQSSLTHVEMTKRQQYDNSLQLDSMQLQAEITLIKTLGGGYHNTTLPSDTITTTTTQPSK